MSLSNNMMRIALQEFNEKRYNRKHIDAKVRAFIDGDANMQEGVQEGVALLEGYVSKTYYESKQARVQQLIGFDFKKLVTDVFVGMAYTKRDELFTSVTARLAGALGFDDKPAAITTMAEVIAVLCATNVYDILKPSIQASLVVRHYIPLPKELKDFVDNAQYLPPLLCEPKTLINNYSSGYLTHNDSLLLGKGNHHDGDLCLDVLNSKNRVPLKLDLDFLTKVELEATKVMTSPDQLENWKNFKTQSYEFYHLMATQGNQFYITNKVDKRGRIYACGYHISFQGTAFHKASIELFNEEVIDGF